MAGRVAQCSNESGVFPVEIFAADRGRCEHRNRIDHHDSLEPAAAASGDGVASESRISGLRCAPSESVLTRENPWSIPATAFD